MTRRTLTQSNYSVRSTFDNLANAVGSNLIGGQPIEAILRKLDHYDSQVIELVRAEKIPKRAKALIEEYFLRGRLLAYKEQDQGTVLISIPEIVFNRGYQDPKFYPSEVVTTNHRGKKRQITFSTPVYRDAFDEFAKTQEVSEISSLYLDGLYDKTKSVHYRYLMTTAWIAGLSSQWLIAKKCLPQAKTYQFEDAKRRNADHWDGF